MGIKSPVSCMSWLVAMSLLVLIGHLGCQRTTSDPTTTPDEQSATTNSNEDRDSGQIADDDFDPNDKDGDGIINSLDNCPSVPDVNQLDSDLDGLGNVCDDDDDNDAILDVADNCAMIANPSQDDQDKDGTGDLCDLVVDDTVVLASPVIFQAITFDPEAEDTAGAHVVTYADMNDDGLLDVISASNDSQPIQLHLQERNADGDISFNTFSIAGSGPYTEVSDLEVADFDEDGHLDIAVSISDTGFTFLDIESDGTVNGALYILFAPADPADNLNWTEVSVAGHFECTVEVENPTELGDTDGDGFVNYNGTITDQLLGFNIGQDGEDETFTAIDVSDIDNDGDVDIVAAFNGVVADFEEGKAIELWNNPGGAAARDEEEFVDIELEDLNFDEQPDCQVIVTRGFEKTVLRSRVNTITSVEIIDINQDQNDDIIHTAPESATRDLPWLENFGNGYGDGGFLHPIGENNSGLAMATAPDLDLDGRPDVLSFSDLGGSLHWFKNPTNPSNQFFPWEVYNIKQLAEGAVPTALSYGDMDGDGDIDAVMAVGSRLYWYSAVENDPTAPWSEFPFFSDTAADTVINSVVVVDLDDDGRNDVLATLDRIGTVNDRLVWLRNID
ncbi:MAG: hypothetical protein HJJLKODD_00016 [Phycisphaerae bacterium]|nr:hypothetical protein [Phycisphaerae bacterium]